MDSFDPKSLFPDANQLFADSFHSNPKPTSGRRNPFESMQSHSFSTHNDAGVSESLRKFLNGSDGYKQDNRFSSAFNISPPQKETEIFDLPSIESSPNPFFVRQQKIIGGTKNKIQSNRFSMISPKTTQSQQKFQKVNRVQPFIHTRKEDVIESSPPRDKTKMRLDIIPETPNRNEVIIESPPRKFYKDKNFSFEKPSFYKPEKVTLPAYNGPNGTFREEIKLHSVDELPNKYQEVFANFSHFNAVQSQVFDSIVFSDSPVVVCAPTGSGKTAIFELAIVRLLIQADEKSNADKNKKAKIVYMAPVKALCSERHEDWSRKFGNLGLNCQEMTGDSNVENLWQLQQADIVLTTPEKWDSMTRRWRENTSFVRRVSLFLIDEVHLLNDETRGATMEAVVSRMKTVRTLFQDMKLRFIAVSATIPNTEDIAEWLGGSAGPAIKFKMDDSYRPVQLRRVVLGYPSHNTCFKFDISLNYRLANVIHTYSENKPTLVFCATRKSVEQAATVLLKDLSLNMSAETRHQLTNSTSFVRNHKLRDFLVAGIGYHHAGLDSHDRNIVEDLFTKGNLMVLISTSTLAMGVNLPAHLVVIKSTQHYVKGMFQEYSQSEILQMIGRAGRPQFDTSATAVIMTKEQCRQTYLNMVSGAQKIESSLHNNLIEHLNAEIVLSTIQDISMALEWIRSTFLYIRLQKHPTYYGYPAGLTREQVESRLHDLCMKNLELLTSVGLVSISDDTLVRSSTAGQLMARYCIAFGTMKTFKSLKGTESLEEMLDILSGCDEFKEVTLRQNEKTALNKLNKDKNKITIRFPMNGKIRSTHMKVNCLLQATLGSMTIQDFTLMQDVARIFRNATRVTRCLLELLMLDNNFKAFYNAAILSKCVKARLWENSRYVTKQLTNIGQTLSSALVNSGVCSFERVLSTDPRELEMIVNRNPPFGNSLREMTKGLPKYVVEVEQGKKYSVNTCDVQINIKLTNASDVTASALCNNKHTCILLIGDADNNIIAKQRISDSQLQASQTKSWTKSYNIKRAKKGDELAVKLLSFDWVGLDIENTYTPYYIGPRRVIAPSPDANFTSNYFANSSNNKISKSNSDNSKKKPCKHTCYDKLHCAHPCCKIGITDKFQKTPLRNTTSIRQQSSSNMLHQFEYKPRNRVAQQPVNEAKTTPAQSVDDMTGWEDLDSFCIQQLNESRISNFEDDFEDRARPLKVSGWDKEQQLYNDQINIGSRINEGEKDASFNNSGTEQLWTVHGELSDYGCTDITEDEVTAESIVSPARRQFSQRKIIFPTFKNSGQDALSSSNDRVSYSNGNLYGKSTTRFAQGFANRKESNKNEQKMDMKSSESSYQDALSSSNDRVSYSNGNLYGKSTTRFAQGFENRKENNKNQHQTAEMQSSNYQVPINSTYGRFPPSSYGESTTSSFSHQHKPTVQQKPPMSYNQPAKTSTFLSTNQINEPDYDPYDDDDDDVSINCDFDLHDADADDDLQILNEYLDSGATDLEDVGKSTSLDETPLNNSSHCSTFRDSGFGSTLTTPCTVEKGMKRPYMDTSTPNSNPIKSFKQTPGRSSNIASNFSENTCRRNLNPTPLNPQSPTMNYFSENNQFPPCRSNQLLKDPFVSPLNENSAKLNQRNHIQPNTNQVNMPDGGRMPFQNHQFDQMQHSSPFQASTGSSKRRCSDYFYQEKVTVNNDGLKSHKMFENIEVAESSSSKGKVEKSTASNNDDLEEARKTFASIFDSLF